MSPRAVTARSLDLVLLLVAVAACGAGALPSSPASPAATPATPATTIPDARDSPAAPTPTEVPSAPTPVPAGPPVATLRGLSGRDMAGDLGTFSWDGLASDAPWIVGGTAAKARTRAVLAVAFPPDAGETAWRARWAPLTGNQPGTPVDGGSGGRDAIELTPPATPGPWSLQLVVDFGPGRNAAWYWRVEVAP